MPIDGIGAVGAAEALQGARPLRAGDEGAGFAASLSSAVDEAQRLSGESKTLALQAVTGDLTDIHAAMIASTRASIALELLAAVRNKGVDAFTEIMRMQA